MNAIKIADWMSVHPYKTPRSADYAYLKVANKLYNSCRFSLLKNDFDDETRIIISTVVAAYFEDVISNTNLWGAFIHKHKEMYGKYLPFYDTSGELYYEDEINPQDVLFLIWSTLQKSVVGTFMNPENPGVVDLAERMYQILDEEFENASPNDYFLDYIQNEKHYKDFFAFKPLANWLFYESFLLGVENSILLKEELDEADEADEDDSIPLDQLEYGARSDALFGQKTGPLALPLKEWYVAMIEGMGMQKEIALINAIENHGVDYFWVDRTDEIYLYIKDTTGKEIPVLRSSFQNLSKETLRNKILVTSLVKYTNEWHVNGLTVWLDEESTYWDLVEKKKYETRIRKDIYEKMLKINNGSPIAYFAHTSELQPWVNKLLDVPGSADIGLKNKENIVVFASPDEDIRIIPDVGCYIKDPKNPLYNPEKAEVMGLNLLVDHYSCPSDMYHYLYENKMLPPTRINSLLGEKRARELVQDNVDFIARFFKWNNY